jgi:hypothetical protein
MPATLPLPQCASLSLTRDEVQRWHDLGYLGPYTLVTPEEMARLRARIDADIFVAESARPARERNHDRHLDHPAVWRLCSLPPLVERVASLIGPDLILWRSNFQMKEPGDPAVPWHQDGAYYGLSPCVLVSAWIAVDEATRANGCLRILPGSHRRQLAHREDPSKEAFGKAIDFTDAELERAVSLELRPGEFVLFNEFTAHGSDENRTALRRLGLSPRITVPFVRIDGGVRRVALLRGRDYAGLNQVVATPDG